MLLQELPSVAPRREASFTDAIEGSGACPQREPMGHYLEAPPS